MAAAPRDCGLWFLLVGSTYALCWNIRRCTNHVVSDCGKAASVSSARRGSPKIQGIEARNGPASNALRIAAAIHRVHRVVWWSVPRADVLVKNLALWTGVVGARVVVIVVVRGAGVVGIGYYTAAKPGGHGCAGVSK
jgi:hypothetical protein